jgi:hypothetical protein
MACYKEAEDIDIENTNNGIRALDFPGDIEDIREIEIGGPSRIGDQLTTSSSDELLDPPITRVSENKTKSNDDEVIPSSYPPETSTFI